MSKETISREDAINEVRKACRQFAMLYFHFSRALVDEFGVDRARELIQKAIFELAIDRSGQLREKAEEKGLPYTIESFMQVIDIPFLGWVKELGKNHCPYAETWRKYYDEHPWFKEIAPFYCDVIDTTNAEHFTQTHSHTLHQNVLIEGDSCEREYFESETVKKGGYSYGGKPGIKTDETKENKNI